MIYQLHHDNIPMLPSVLYHSPAAQDIRVQRNETAHLVRPAGWDGGSQVAEPQGAHATNIRGRNNDSSSNKGHPQRPEEGKLQ